MNIAVISDIHDNIWTLRAAISFVQEADVLICCGDLCSPFILPMIAERYTKPIKLVFGNNDGDLFRITRQAVRFSNIQIAAEYYQDELGGLKVAAVHYDNIGLDLARSGQFDLVCFGHNHRHQVEYFGTTLAINPGALMGYSPLENKEISPTFIIYDTDTKEVKSCQVVNVPAGTTAVKEF